MIVLTAVGWITSPPPFSSSEPAQSPLALSSRETIDEADDVVEWTRHRPWSMPKPLGVKTLVTSYISPPSRCGGVHPSVVGGISVQSLIAGVSPMSR